MTIFVDMRTKIRHLSRQYWRSQKEVELYITAFQRVTGQGGNDDYLWEAQTTATINETTLQVTCKVASQVIIHWETTNCWWKEQQHEPSRTRERIPCSRLLGFWKWFVNLFTFSYNSQRLINRVTTVFKPITDATCNSTPSSKSGGANKDVHQTTHVTNPNSDFQCDFLVRIRCTCDATMQLTCITRRQSL